MTTRTCPKCGSAIEDEGTGVTVTKHNGGCPWDLSPNDKIALNAAIVEVNNLRSQLAEVTRQRDEAGEQNRLLQDQLDETIVDRDTAVEALELYANNRESIARKALAAIRGKETT